jgi:hypothetical protein
VSVEIVIIICIFLKERVVQEEYVYNMHNTVEKTFEELDGPAVTEAKQRS